jgi:hypothetical protein
MALRPGFARVPAGDPTRERYDPPDVTWLGAAAGVGAELGCGVLELEPAELELLGLELLGLGLAEGESERPSAPAVDGEPEAPALEADRVPDVVLE